MQSSRSPPSHMEQAHSTSMVTAAGHTCHAKLKGRLGNGCGHLGGDLPQLPQLWVDFGSRNLLWGDCTQARSALVKHMHFVQVVQDVIKTLHQGTDRQSSMVSRCRQRMHIPHRSPPTIVCQGSCSCYEHFIFDGLGLYQYCSKADTFRQGGMVTSPEG